jgi:hypothetical protein
MVSPRSSDVDPALCPFEQRSPTDDSRTGREQEASTPWHRIFHPLCGADLPTLVGLLVRGGPPSPGRLPAVAIALGTALLRLPFTFGERAIVARAIRRAPPASPPLFIVGHMRSGTTHLHNLLAAAGQFGTVPPVLAGLPWEALSLARLLRPFIDEYLPTRRFMDAVRIESSSPTEDEIALANMLPISYYHAIYFPRRFARSYRAGLLFEDCRHADVQRSEKLLLHYLQKMALRDRSRPLLVKNPAYTARIGRIRELWPGAKFIHIYRDPYAVFESSRRALSTVLRELALQRYEQVPIEDIVLDVYPRMMDGLLRDAHRLSEREIVHVRFEDLEADPLHKIARVYRALDLPDFCCRAPRDRDLPHDCP